MLDAVEPPASSQKSKKFRQLPSLQKVLQFARFLHQGTLAIHSAMKWRLSSAHDQHGDVCDMSVQAMRCSRMMLPEMLNILSLPDEVLRLVARRVLKKRNGERKWCRLARTCKRLWRLQLAPQEHTWEVPAQITLPGASRPVLKSREITKLMYSRLFSQSLAC